MIGSRRRREPIIARWPGFIVAQQRWCRRIFPAGWRVIAPGRPPTGPHRDQDSTKRETRVSHPACLANRRSLCDAQNNLERDPADIYLEIVRCMILAPTGRGR
jgi:hypothetical protein